MSPITYFVTLNWNTTDLLKEMIESVESTTPEAHRWIIVDNGSANGDVAALFDFARRTFGNFIIAGAEGGTEHLCWRDSLAGLQAAIVGSRINLGCIEGHNLAFDVARFWSNDEPHEIVMINTDVVVNEEGWLSKVLEWTAERPSVGIVGMEHGPNAVCAPAVFLDRNGNWYLHETQMKTAESVEGESVGLGFALVRWPVLEAGLRFDMGYKMYYKQDDDLCFQVRADLGLDVWVYPVDNIHYGSGSLKANQYKVGEARGWDEFDQVKQANQRYFAKKWHWALGDRRRNMTEQAAWLAEMKGRIGSRK